MTPTACSICGEQAGGAEFCPPCEGLLRWVRAYFERFPDLASRVVPNAGLFMELDIHSLDYMDWLLEAEEKLNIDITDHQARDVETVGEFVQMLKEAGARWPEDRDLRIVKSRKWCQLYGWEAVDRPK